MSKICKDIITYALEHKEENCYFNRNKDNFIALINLISKSKSGFARSLSTRKIGLLKWIDDELPLLRNAFYQISTKCYWILMGLVSFPKCKHCGASLTKKNVKLNFGYNDFCSVSCQVMHNGILRNEVKKRWQKFHQQHYDICQKNIYQHQDYKNLVYQILSHTSCFEQLSWLIENRSDSCMQILKSKHFEHLLKFVFDESAFLDAYHPSITERTYCVLNHIDSISDARLRCHTCGKPLIGKSCSLAKGFKDYCSLKCVARNEQLVKQKKETHFKKYGCYGDALETKLKRKQTFIKHFGTTHWCTRICDYTALTDEQKVNRKNVWDKHTYVMEKNHGMTNYGYSHRCDAYVDNIFSFNTFNYDAKQQFKRSSKDENKCFYMLLWLYPHLIRQHKSITYPFNCDFYDPDSDTYIEFNGSWVHGKHFYDPNNENDIAIATRWKNNEHTIYQSAYDTWTIRDVKKRKIAQDNNLNYIVFWKVEEVREYVLRQLQKYALNVNKNV